MIFLLTALCLIGHTTVTWAEENDGAVIADSASVYQKWDEYIALKETLKVQNKPPLQIAEAYVQFREQNENIIGAPGNASIMAANEYIKIDDHESALDCYQWAYDRYRIYNEKPELRKYHPVLPYTDGVFGIAQCYYLIGNFLSAKKFYEEAMVKLKRDDHEKSFIPFAKPIAKGCLPSGSVISPKTHPELYPTKDPYMIFRYGGVPYVSELMLQLINEELEGGEK